MAQYRVVKQRGKKGVRVPVDAEGFATTEYLQGINGRRSARARQMDGQKQSKYTIEQPVSPKDAVRWARSPGKTDIAGIDTPFIMSIPEKELEKATRKATKAKAKTEKAAKKGKKAKVKEPEPVPVEVISVGPFDGSRRLSDGPYEAIYELNDGKVMMAQEGTGFKWSKEELFDEETGGHIVLAGTADYSLWNKGKEWDGGDMGYVADSTYQDLVDFASGPGNGIKRIVLKPGDDDYDDLLASMQSGDDVAYGFFRDKYGLQNRRMRRGF